MPLKLNRARLSRKKAQNPQTALIYPVAIAFGAVSLIVIYAITSNFPGKIDFKGGVEGIHLQIDGGGRK